MKDDTRKDEFIKKIKVWIGCDGSSYWFCYFKRPVRNPQKKSWWYYQHGQGSQYVTYPYIQLDFMCNFLEQYNKNELIEGELIIYNSHNYIKPTDIIVKYCEPHDYYKVIRNSDFSTIYESEESEQVGIVNPFKELKGTTKRYRIKINLPSL